MTNEGKREIRRALLGKTTPMEDKRLTVLPEGEYRFLGVGDGASTVFLFGVTHRSCCYETRLGEAQALKAAAKSMEDIGRALALQDQPRVSACLIRYLLTQPAVLTFELEGGVPVLTAWAGRSLTGWISVRRALSAFEKHMPKEFRLSERKPPMEKAEAEAQKKKSEKKKAKQNKRKKDAEKPDAKPEEIPETKPEEIPEMRPEDQTEPQEQESVQS